MKNNKFFFLKIIALCLMLATFCLAAASCGEPAPAGMYAPKDAEKYVEGVEHAIFSVPLDYTVRMSSNTLSAEKGESVFSLQCRHSDYYYGSLKRNYEELKSQLLGLYGSYEETLGYDRKVAGADALEARYTLHISGVDYDYVQYFFYESNKQFYLFTYSAPQGQTDEELLSAVLSSVSLDKENYKVPEGMKAVENAQADEISFDEYEIYIPDDWILDTSAGQICMRVPSARTVSTILFHTVEAEDLRSLVDDYAAKFASDMDFSSLGVTEKYILTSVRRMMREYKDFKIVCLSDGNESSKELSANTLLSLKDEYLQTYTSSEKLTFTYIEYTARLTDFADHGSGGLFIDTTKVTDDDEAEKEREIKAVETLADYRVRQYFISRGEKLYFFTYLSTESAFKNQEADAVKVVKNFVLK